MKTQSKDISRITHNVPARNASREPAGGQPTTHNSQLDLTCWDIPVGESCDDVTLPTRTKTKHSPVRAADPKSRV